MTDIDVRMTPYANAGIHQFGTPSLVMADLMSSSDAPWRLNGYLSSASSAKDTPSDHTSRRRSLIDAGKRSFIVCSGYKWASIMPLPGITLIKGDRSYRHVYFASCHARFARLMKHGWWVWFYYQLNFAQLIFQRTNIKLDLPWRQSGWLRSQPPWRCRPLPTLCWLA